MKIVVLAGSPHKKGSSNLLAEQFIQGAEESGHSVQVLDVAHMNIRPCLGCGHCGMDGECAHKDDNVVIRDALLGADMAVFVTPIYYFGMSAQMKLVIDRFYSYTMKLTGKRLKTALIAAAYDTDMKTMSYLRDHYVGLCDYMHFKNMGMILGTGCGTPSMTRGTKHMQAAYDLGKSL